MKTGKARPRSLRLLVEGGTGKDGKPEPVRLLQVKAGEVLAVVGPTGSGKTRLLADVERLARGDSPSGRRVRLEGADSRGRTPETLVARLSQAMGFYLDATAGEFLRLHAEHRGRAQPAALAAEALAAANGLVGEPFDADVPLALLSGGQARALMVADVVLVSACPVVLIDELENAGIDRLRALDFLLAHRVIALVATHDPLIALRADRRLVMAGGAVRAVVRRSPAEAALLRRLEHDHVRTEALKDRLRRGAPVVSRRAPRGVRRDPAR
ncbi:MAG: ATP-binding cassette domain-containing protein [Deltaproteobacteria bacterium]|nr:ATP-binding cassette domain-containing protein [Deltaproteobacteria bacterium]